MAVICRWTIYKYLVILSDKHTLLDPPFSVEEAKLFSMLATTTAGATKETTKTEIINNNNNSVTQYQ